MAGVLLGEVLHVMAEGLKVYALDAFNVLDVVLVGCLLPVCALRLLQMVGMEVGWDSSTNLEVANIALSWACVLMGVRFLPILPAW